MEPGGSCVNAARFAVDGYALMPAYMCLTITGQEEFEMHLTVLAVPGCPNVALLEEQLASVLDGRPGVTVSRHVIAEEAEAASWGMHGSPTILINGADPFAEPGQSASMSCRLYRGSDGRISGVPSAGQLRQAIERAAENDDDADSPGWLDALGRGGRGRIAPSECGLKAVHQAVLRSFRADRRPARDVAAGRCRRAVRCRSGPGRAR